MKIAIIGRKCDTANYEKYISQMPATPITSMGIGELSKCSALILPGGGDITPAFFGEHNTASKNIDTELDIIQFQAFDYAVSHFLPILGICKGMQLINVALGGTITQHLLTAENHQYKGTDQYHLTKISKSSCLFSLYGEQAYVNSAHHQGISRLGNNLVPIQWCELDHCVEAVVHETLPILGLQWHPERLDATKTSITSTPILHLFHTWITKGRIL